MNKQIRQILFLFFYLILFIVVSICYYRVFDFITLQLKISYEMMDAASIIFVLIYVVIVLPGILITSRYIKSRFEKD